MRGGLWKFNGETLKFSKSGKLLDGQHRLNALIESGTTQKFYVIQGLPDDTMSTIDTGITRGAADILKLNGFEYSTLAASVLRGLMQLKDGNFSNQKQYSNSLISNETILEFAKKNRNTVAHVCEVAQKHYMEFKMLSPTIYGVFYYNIHLKNRFKADKFMNQLSKGVGLTENDAIFHFRKKIIDEKIKGLKLSKKAQYFYLYKCWNFFLEGKQVKRLPSFDDKKRINELLRA